MTNDESAAVTSRLEFVIRVSSFSLVARPPDRLVPVLAEQQAAIFRYRNSHWPPPDISFRRDKPGHEILVITARFPGRFVERHPDDFVSGAALAVPGAVERG